jgi:hypothetical protein
MYYTVTNALGVGTVSCLLAEALAFAGQTNETVEKHKFDRTYYTQVRNFSAQLGNNSIR